MLKPPKFWKKTGIINFFLLPLSLVYYICFIIYGKIFKEIRTNTPVICVGNLVLGGVGKTPLTIKLRELLSKDFKKIFVLTRGYKGKEKGPIIVSKNMNYKDVGDESLIHCVFGSTCVSKSKVEGAKLCEKKGANLIILDDGFQSKHICKDLSILVIDPELGLNNRFMFPAGPLRQPFFQAIRKCDAILILDKKIYRKNFNLIKHKNIFFGKKIMKIDKIKNDRVLAFCGIGNNERFFNGLKNLNLKPEKCISFPDHHNYSIIEIKHIIKQAEERNLSIVCTRKDYVKIPLELKKNIHIVDTELVIEKEMKFYKFLVSELKKTSLY